ncbi:MAG TPA: ArsC/Spx/MgsR family protein [Bacteroidota bacterium]|nr:ArsC/Spx/MgsR family protein [Bacteroidota bacterium]
MKITLYQKPTCSTCRQVYRELKSAGVDFEEVDYFVEPIPEAKLRTLVSKMGVKPQSLFRKNERIYRKLRLGEKDVSDDEAIALMVKHPELLQRPILERGTKAILARPAERLREILREPETRLLDQPA